MTAYPDGETDERRFWTFFLPTRTYSRHPDLEEVNGPPSGRVVQPATGASREEWDRSWWTFKVRSGVDSIAFGPLGYVEAATRSYRDFRRLRNDGALPANARFQVCLPTTGSAVMGFFADPHDWPLVYDAYRRAVRQEVAEIADAIPHDDLLIQWDTASEVRDILAGDQPLLTWSPAMAVQEKWERHLSDMGTLSDAIPEGVLLGYHFCFGTWGGWPKSVAPDIGVCVRMANEAVARAGRRVDYVHMPVMPNASEAFFRPLSELKIGEARTYLGIVLDDGVHQFERRAKAASQYLPDFGIASYCGWGREEPRRMPALLENLRACAERLPDVMNAPSM